MAFKFLDVDSGGDGDVAVPAKAAEPSVRNVSGRRSSRRRASPASHAPARCPACMQGGFSAMFKSSAAGKGSDSGLLLGKSTASSGSRGASAGLFSKPTGTAASSAPRFGSTSSLAAGTSSGFGMKLALSNSNDAATDAGSDTSSSNGAGLFKLSKPAAAPATAVGGSKAPALSSRLAARASVASQRAPAAPAAMRVDHDAAPTTAGDSCSADDAENSDIRMLPFGDECAASQPAVEALTVVDSRPLREVQVTAPETAAASQASVGKPGTPRVDSARGMAAPPAKPAASTAPRPAGAPAAVDRSGADDHEASSMPPPAAPGSATNPAAQRRQSPLVPAEIREKLLPGAKATLAASLTTPRPAATIKPSYAGAVPVTVQTPRFATSSLSARMGAGAVSPAAKAAPATAVLPKRVTPADPAATLSRMPAVAPLEHTTSTAPLALLGTADTSAVSASVSWVAPPTAAAAERDESSAAAARDVTADLTAAAPSSSASAAVIATAVAGAGTGDAASAVADEVAAAAAPAASGMPAPEAGPAAAIRSAADVLNAFTLFEQQANALLQSIERVRSDGALAGASIATDTARLALQYSGDDGCDTLAMQALHVQLKQALAEMAAL